MGKAKRGAKDVISFAGNPTYKQIKVVEVAIPLDYDKGKSTKTLFEYKIDKAIVFIRKHTRVNPICPFCQREQTIKRQNT